MPTQLIVFTIRDHRCCFWSSLSESRLHHSQHVHLAGRKQVNRLTVDTQLSLNLCKLSIKLFIKKLNNLLSNRQSLSSTGAYNSQTLDGSVGAHFFFITLENGTKFNFRMGALKSSLENIQIDGAIFIGC